jgi:cystathionine beta-lyase
LTLGSAEIEGRGRKVANTMSGSPLEGSSKGKGKVNATGKALQTRDIDGHDLPPSPAPSTPRNGRKYALMTELVYTESNDQYNASSVPIYQVHIQSSSST